MKPEICTNLSSKLLVQKSFLNLHLWKILDVKNYLSKIVKKYLTFTDAILDRIMHDAYKINIENIDPSKDISMREVYGLDKSLSE